MQLTDTFILINASGVHTDDKMGNKYYRKAPQKNINMTLKLFKDSQKVWAEQFFNGIPLRLKEAKVLTAANSIIPYNSISEKAVTPAEGKTPNENRTAWYNLTFDMGTESIQTGWMCNNLYNSAYNASVNAASGVADSLVNNPLVRSSVMRMLEANFNQKTR